MQYNKLNTLVDKSNALREQAELNPPAEVTRAPDGKWLPGTAPPNPAGRPKKMAMVEAMLDAEFRNVESMRETYTLLRQASHSELTATIAKPGSASGAFTKMYLERTQGPVKELQVDMADAPPEVTDWIVKNLA